MAIKEVEGTPGRPGRKGFYTLKATGDDVRKMRGRLDKQARVARERKAQYDAKKKIRVRNFAGSTKMVNEKSLETILAMQRANPRRYPKGPPASRVSVCLGASIRNGRVIRDGED